MRKLESLEQISLEYENWDESRISGYTLISKLNDNYERLQIESMKENKNQSSSLEYDEITGELKFRLLINDISNRTNKPNFGGSIEFNKTIVLKPGVEYTFGVWEREGNEMYLTMIPTENITNSPTPKRLSKQPVHIQNAINDYFDKVYGSFD